MQNQEIGLDLLRNYEKKRLCQSISKKMSTSRDLGNHVVSAGSLERERDICQLLCCTASHRPFPLFAFLCLSPCFLFIVVDDVDCLLETLKNRFPSQTKATTTVDSSSPPNGKGQQSAHTHTNLVTTQREDDDK